MIDLALKPYSMKFTYRCAIVSQRINTLYNRIKRTTVTTMTALIFLKKRAYLLVAFLIAACQPIPPTDEPESPAGHSVSDAPITITADSVTLTSDHILSIKPSRYQPSLGLQGIIEPIKKTTLIAAHPIYVETILVNEGQWVEKGTPLFFVRRLDATSEFVPSDSPTSDHLVDNPSSKNSLSTDPLSTDSSSKKPSSTSKAMADHQAAQNANDTKPKETAQTNSETTVRPKSDQVDAIKTGTANQEKSSAVVDKNGDKVSRDETNNHAANDNATNDNAANDSGAINDKSDNADNTASLLPQDTLITVSASFSGRVEHLYIKADQKLAARTSLLQLNDETKLRFVASLPIQTESQLSVGQTVNFTAESMSDTFTGQVSKLVTDAEPNTLLLYVNIIENEMSRDKLLPSMKVTGRVNYGQIEVGTIVPEQALHDVNLTALQIPPHKPLNPISANVWIIGQDQRLTRQSVEVIEYNPTSKQYLIAGISNDSLICLASLPIDSKGKKVIVS